MPDIELDRDSHALLSPSSSERWMACPGSIHATAAAIESGYVDVSNDASKQGTVAHALLEVCILFGFDPQQLLDHHLLGADMPAVAQHMIDGVQNALDWVEEYTDHYGAENLIVMPEHRVFIGDMIGVSDEQCNGTTDLQIVHKDNSCLVSIDYKHGIMPVEVEDNPQLMLYTAGGVKEHGKFKEYKNVVVQPRAAKKNVVDEVTFKNSKLTQFLEKAKRAAMAALNPNAPRTAGPHCRFCPARANCQVYRTRVRQIAADEFDALPDPRDIPDSQLNRIAKEIKEMQAWINTMQARLVTYLQNGGKLADFELGWGPRRRIFQDEADVIEWCKRHKLPPDTYMPRTLLTPAALETALKKHGMFPRAKRGEQKPDSPIAHLVGYTIPKPAIKPRKEVTDFDEVEDEDV